jgi:hypothetical protein
MMANMFIIEAQARRFAFGKAWRINRGEPASTSPMNSYRKWIGTLITACALTAAAFAAESSPAGIWKWTVQGRQGQGFEQTVRLEYKDGKLSGVMPGRDAGQFSVPDTPISNASFNDGQVKFAVTREFNGQKFTTTYEGKLVGDTITGTFERSGATKGPSKSEWVARRKI